MVLQFTTMICGCKSKPVISGVPVYTFDALDSEGAMYIHIPPKENQELLVAFVKNIYKGLSTDDAELIVSKLEDVYASFGSKKDKKRVQIALKGNVPSIVKSLLKKNGFEEKTYNAKSLIQSKIAPYSYFDNGDIQISFPSANQILISQSIPVFIDMFNMEKEVCNSEIVLETPFREDWKGCDLYKWISEEIPSIHFYIVRPQAFLTNLIGADISTRVFKLVYAKGDFTKLPNQKYELTLDLEFQNKIYVKPAISILILTLGLTDSEIQQVSDTHIKLTGVHLNSNQLINMLGL